MKQRIIVHGTMTQGEHGLYLIPDPKCDAQSGIRIQGPDYGGPYFYVGGHKGVGVSATIEGELVMSKLVPKLEKAPYLAFSARRIRYERTQIQLK